MKLSDLDILLPQPQPAPGLVTRWGEVTALSPLRVKLDGDDTALPLTPASLVAGLSVGSRVWTMLSGRQIVILGAWGGIPAPDPTPAIPAGTVFVNAGATTPSGYLKCDGATYNTADYPALATALGAGGSTFTVPNIKGRVVVGLDAADSDFDARGKTGGSKSHVHALSSGWAWLRLASGQTGMFAKLKTIGVDTTTWSTRVTINAPVVESNTSTNATQLGGTTDNGPTLPPYAAFDWIIKT